MKYALLFCLLPLAAAAAPVRYDIESTHSYPTFAVSHFGFSELIGRFNRTQGFIVLDREVQRGEIEVSIDAASIDTGLPARDTVLRSKDFFQVSQYPVLRFHSTQLRFDKDQPVAADGELTLTGITLPVALKIERLTCGRHPYWGRNACGAKVTTEFRRSAFGMKYGLPFVGDTIRIRIDLAALESPAD